MKDEQQRDFSGRIGERVRIFRRGSTWYVNYQLGGKQFRQSLKTEIKKTAIHRALKLDRKLADGEAPTNKEPIGISEAISAYKEYLVAEKRAAKTKSKYWRVFTAVEELAQSMSRHLISQVDLTFVDKFRAKRAKDCAPKTVYTEVVIVRQLVKFAFTRGLVDKDPLLGLKTKKPKPTPQPCFDDEQIEQIHAHARPPHDATYLLLAENGLRFGEAQWLTWADVDFKVNVIHVRAKDTWKPKTGDERAVPMSPKLVMLLRRLPRRGRWVLTAMTTKKCPQEGRQISERRALVALKRVLSNIGIAGKLHSFRHSFISRCLTNGIEEAVVRSWVGHFDPSIMRLYTHITSKVSQERIKLLGESAPRGESTQGDTKTA